MLFCNLVYGSVSIIADTINRKTSKIIESSTLEQFSGTSLSEAIECITSRTSCPNVQEYLNNKQIIQIGEIWLEAYEEYYSETKQCPNFINVRKTMRLIEASTGLVLFKTKHYKLEKRNIHKVLLVMCGLVGLSGLGLIIGGIIGLSGVFGVLVGSAHGTFGLAIVSGVTALLSAATGGLRSWDHLHSNNK